MKQPVYSQWLGCRAESVVDNFDGLGATGLIIRRVEISYTRIMWLITWKGRPLSRCSTPTPVSRLRCVGGGSVCCYRTGNRDGRALEISTTLASVTSWAMSNSESVVRDFGDAGHYCKSGKFHRVLVADGSNGGEFSVKHLVRRIGPLWPPASRQNLGCQAVQLHPIRVGFTRAIQDRVCC